MAVAHRGCSRGRPGERACSSGTSAARIGRRSCDREWVRTGAYLVPLRLFIGLGWLRACAERSSIPGWRDGSSLAAFLSGHLSAGEVAFPWYETLIARLFLPHAGAVRAGDRPGAAPCRRGDRCRRLDECGTPGGTFMNLNFLLAGAPNPSTFYIVIQVALLLTNAGAILGLDAILAKTLHNPLLVAQPPAARRRRRWKVRLLPAGAISLITAIYALAHVTDWSPAGSVEDPAMIVAILALLSLAWATIAWLRQDAGGRGGLLRRATRSRTGKEHAQRGAAGIPRLRQIAAATADWARCGASTARWSRSPHQPRRLALTVTLALLDVPRDGDRSQRRTAYDVVPVTARRRGGFASPPARNFSLPSPGPLTSV